MEWNQSFIHLPQYEDVSTNQYGKRYKKTNSKQIRVAILTANFENISENGDDLRTLFLLSHKLNVPVHYNFDTKPQTAFIEVVGKESL